MKTLEIGQVVIGQEAKEFYETICNNGDMYAEDNKYSDKNTKRTRVSCESGEYKVTFVNGTDTANRVERTKKTC